MEFQKESLERNAANPGLIFQWKKKKMELSCFLQMRVFYFYLIYLTSELVWTGLQGMGKQTKIAEYWNDSHVFYFNNDRGLGFQRLFVLCEVW